jgi:hypothetical protein
VFQVTCLQIAHQRAVFFKGRPCANFAPRCESRTRQGVNFTPRRENPFKNCPQKRKAGPFHVTKNIFFMFENGLSRFLATLPCWSKSWNVVAQTLTTFHLTKRHLLRLHLD